tara:strand:- start:34689 stop:35600 length:912 start_codon:yes stop_codon:yes gene_type:complete
MRKVLLAAFAVLLSLPSLAIAQERMTLGFGRMFSNDGIGDTNDRWRTGSYAVSMVRGPQWQGVLPASFGEVIEYRGRMEIIAPSNLTNPSPADRRYVGTLSFGAHTYFRALSGEARVGLDLVATGSQTGVGKLQSALHGLFGIAKPGNLDNQIGNAVYPTVSVEFGKTYFFGASGQVRPFAEAQAGVESYVRVGGDITFGNFGKGSLMLRDQVTGQRYYGVLGTPERGTSMTVGGDFAKVFDSAYLPKGGAVVMSDTRSRLRAGLRWRGEKSEVFYGVTRLGREFESQPSGQVVGSLRFKLRF